ncbi:MAG TPA: efflux RND transporter periplasmic adaptor subunit [Hyphomonas sp.]|mgnify:FL=1|uniref:efflux RND transporter periplasmic adaptor subunit n=1 Tax=uncultured Hyphomonas sp. TaxID=225298 RepID=UPI000C4908D2|nr:efflux transporter periplasmic adaptor subunit [Hyphomonadaceae bacterium]HBL93820.1 efflux RND transporter periplasmic adaptor subunit [Hyphomonas sp.]HCJ18760.1 efflux RND transporter periplasmic adaptor subunit [Hyphomonas sp.]|tara:strand:- start:10848 stop:12695 length:1848 start_codon:yes stop_codon:yes gene_type:complete
MKQTLIFTASALTILLAACSGEQALPNRQTATAQTASESGEAQQYTCPMHPHYISTDPNGSCPICGMDLVPTSGPSSSGEREILYYKHPMGQPDTSPVPKKDSMGMDYIPVYAEAPASSAVIVAPEMIQTMGVRVAAAETASFAQTVRAFGTVESNERLEAVSVSRLEGWIENLTVRAEGDSVRPGALLYRIYSPELIAAQKDYIAALTIGNENRIAAVRQRLRSIGMQNTTIDRLTETREVRERVPVYAEAGGTVDTLEVREGDYVKPGTPILRLQSYADVWVIASIPEQDLAFIDTGMPVSLDFPSAPKAPGEGRVDYIYPTINPKTRTADVRIEIDNSAGYLRPGAYADIGFDLGGETRLAVPTEAILRDSRGTHVIMALGDGRFAGRAVRTGVSANGLTEILSGLAPGEQVVASGQFMLDSEVNLREGFSKLQAPPAFTAGPDTPLSQLPVDAITLAEIDHFTDMALYFHEAMTDRYKIDPYFVDPALGLGEGLRSRFAGTKLIAVLEPAETALRAAKDAREGDALATTLSDLMIALEPWLLEGAPAHYETAGLVLFSETGTGRLWLQEGGPARNPYGDGASEIVDWPDPMTGSEVSRQERPPIDPHAGHR